MGIIPRMLLSGDEAIIETDRCAWTLLIAFLPDNVEKPSHLLDISNTRNIIHRLDNICSFLNGDQGSAKLLSERASEDSRDIRGRSGTPLHSLDCKLRIYSTDISEADIKSEVAGWVLITMVGISRSDSLLSTDPRYLQ